MALNQTEALSTWESNLKNIFWRLMKNPKYAKDSYSWGTSDLSGARKWKTFIKGRFLWEKVLF